MFNRRTFLSGIGVGLALAYWPCPIRGEEHKSIPVIMFHKVDDEPKYPEDISSAQLERLFAYLWSSGFHPVNMSDIIDGRLDKVVPKGFKPVGITADDSHRSIVFSKKDVTHPEQRNAGSFVDIFASSLKPHGYEPRATFFLSAVGDDRYSKEPEGYFGEVKPLLAVLESLSGMPCIEFGYHTRVHKSMGNMGAVQVTEIIEDQRRDFEKSGVSEFITPILAYPYGISPKDEGIAALRGMGFKGAVLAYPGVNESKYGQLPQCSYSGVLLTDNFLIPRVCVGSHTYAAKGKNLKNPYIVIDPIEDFKKDFHGV